MAALAGAALSDGRDLGWSTSAGAATLLAQKVMQVWPLFVHGPRCFNGFGS
jgi:hypothetical protein